MVLGDPGEVGLLEPLDLQPVPHDAEGGGGPELEGALAEEVAPLGQGGLVGQGAVVGLVEAVALKRLDPAAGLEDAVGLLEELAPVGDGAHEPAQVDKVERVVLEGPLLRVVVDLADVLSDSFKETVARDEVELTSARWVGSTGVGWARGRCQ